MQQNDYILREIEKIGVLLRALFNKLRGAESMSTAISIGEQKRAAEEMLNDEIRFNLEKFLSLHKDEVEEYLFSIQGMDIRNTEMLADYLKMLGESGETEQSNQLLDKALIMYNLCNAKDRTYSLERERKIGEIEQLL